MSETRLEHHVRTRGGRIFNRGTAKSERQCAAWIASPNDEPREHRSKRLYLYKNLCMRDPDRCNDECGKRPREDWFCLKCLQELAEMDEFLHRYRASERIAVVRKVIVEEIPGEFDLLLKLIDHKGKAESVKIEAWPQL